ncbi:hypothetical protein [Amycolatopsis sp. La24]|uniref:hypothetical protein n=1 Tax=Amycolatopsis sp. La24 TaxID=3028304 RepID=UPI0023AF2DA0|nr:hypothetical protein [Amycolatopsis sp. La24]
MSWQEQARANRAAKAEQARLDLAARTGDEIARMRAAGEESRADLAAQAALRAEQDRARREDRLRRKETRAARWAAVRAFAAAHAVDLLIYGIALVSFAMAAPAMAGYGAQVYASPLGRLLPLITELGMWAFAVAVLVSRHRTPERPVWGLQAGVWVFGTVAAATNALHGLDRGWGAGVIMAVVSVAGVVAHQLAIASPPRSRIQRQAARIERKAAAKAAAAARAAVRTAAAAIDSEGRARLTYAPGTYRVRRGRLVAVEPDPDVPGPPDAIDAELAALLARAAAGPSGDTRPAGQDPLHRGPVATADPDRPDRPDPSEDRTGGPKRPGPVRDQSAPAGTSGSGKRSRTYEQLRAELQEAVVAGDLDPATASTEQVRKTLRCRKEVARRLLQDLKPKQ